jgi:hypothetical protein
MLELIYRYFNKLRVTNNSGVVANQSTQWLEDTGAMVELCKNSRQDCLRLQIGSLFSALESLDLWPKKDADEVYMSPSQLQKSLTNIQLSDCQYNNFWGSSIEFGLNSGDPIKRTCGSFARILGQVERVTSQFRGFSTEDQAMHMRAQSNKSRYLRFP